jgi:hypothetical protein
MTNRKDLLDDAIMRPGRLEVQIEVTLPDEKGRYDILTIHTSKMLNNGYTTNINLDSIAKLSVNFTGAEIESIVKNAVSYSISRELDPSNLANAKNIKPIITQDDLVRGYQEIKPLFGSLSNEIGIITSKEFTLYSDNYNYIYDDIINSLTPKNTQILYDHIVNELEGIEVSPDTDELELIASEQGHIDHVVVNSKNINRIVNDKESINELLDSSLSDLRSSLQSLYDSSYNESLFSEYYDSVWDELSRYFIGDKIFTEIPHPYKKDVMVEHISIEIANFYSNLIEYLKDNRSSSNYDTLAYHGTYLTVLAETHGCLRLVLPDYADYRKTEKNINSYFGDYV